MRFPFSFLENIEDDWNLQGFSSSSGLSVSEDEEGVYIKAAMPGNIDEIKKPEAAYKNGILKISFKETKGGPTSKKISIKEG